MASLLPILPAYVADLGGTQQQVGLVMGAFAIGLLLSRPKVGKMIDRQSRKTMLLLGTIVAAIAPIGYLFVHSIPLLIVIRAFHGISIAAFTTAYSTLIVDLSPWNRRGEVIGYMSLVQPLGWGLGPAIGGLLQAELNYLPVFLLASGLGILSFIGGYQVSEKLVDASWHKSRKASQISSVNPSPATDIGQLMLTISLLIPTIVMLLIGIAFGGLSTFLPLFIRETQVELNAGWVYTAAALASFSMRLFIGSASDRYGRGLFITIAVSFYAIAMVLLSQADSKEEFLLAGILEGAGGGTLFPMIIALISDRSPFQQRGQVFSLCIGGFDLGMAIAGPLLGAFAPQLGYRGIFILGAALSCLALMIFLTQSSKNLSHSLRFALGREKDIYALNQLPVISDQ
jgi:MFS family permease